MPFRRRIASLVPSLTHTVCALGADDQLVARTVYCVEPRDRLAAVPACGGTKNPDLRAILALAPDLALACTEENKPEHLRALREAGVEVHEVMPRGLDDTARLLSDYGALLGVDAGPLLDDLAAARTALPASPRRRAAALVWKEPWLAAGGGNHIDGVLSELRLVNVCGDRAGYPELELAELRGLAPDVILLPDEPWRFTAGDARLLADAGILSRTVACDGKDLCWYGAWAADGLRRLAGLLRP